MGKITKIQIIDSEQTTNDLSKFLLKLREFCGPRLISISYKDGDDLSRLEHEFIPSRDNQEVRK